MNTVRRTSQIISLILIVYIGSIGIQSLGFVFSSDVDASEQGSALISSGSDKLDILNAYGPVKTCRYVAGDTRLFTGCALHYFSKTLTTFQSLNFAFILPHIIFFFVLAILFGRAFCGWVCPLGFLEEIMVFARKKLGYKHPKALRESMRYSPSRQKLLQIAKAGRRL